jgi:hypothetical protein
MLPHEAVKALYEAYPYPALGWLSPFLQRVRWDERPLVNYEAGYAAAHGSIHGCAERPRIAVVGSGTFEPVAVALANPRATILAVDLSERSLRQLRWQAQVRGLSQRIETHQGDLRNLPRREFDSIVATGVIHHLPDPAAGLRALVARSHPRTVFRFMIYSEWGRSLLYATKAFAQRMGCQTPKQVRKLIAALPENHPFRIYFHLYSDTGNDAGLADGFLHPCDRPFEAEELGRLMADVGLEATQFLHRPEGQPDHALQLTAKAQALTTWQRIALLELYGELSENFLFYAARADRPAAQRPSGLAWNPALPRKGRLYAKLLDEHLKVDRALNPARLPTEEREKLARGLFLLPEGLA